MLKTHAIIFSEVPIDPLNPGDSDVEKAAMPYIEIVNTDDDINVI